MSISCLNSGATASRAARVSRTARLGAALALLVGVALGSCGAPEVVGPPTSNYVHWGAKDAAGGPTLVEPDHDGDGVLNAVDRCPDLPEDIDGFRDEDGCPDPTPK